MAKTSEAASKKAANAMHGRKKGSLKMDRLLAGFTEARDLSRRRS
jgi:hypothetical protein